MKKHFKAKEAQDPGLGTSFKKSVPRMMNPDGSFNIERVGTVNGYKDFYKFLVDLSAPKFILFVVLVFLFLNTLFAFGYLVIGLNQLSGTHENTHPFLSAFYFSAQTFTTVGYGAIAPKGNGASLLATFEAFFGLITFSIATGLIYGRFSRPSAKIGYSENVIITPYKGENAMMFKIVNLRNSVLLNTRVTVMVSMNHESADASSYTRNYFSLPLEIDFVRFFPLTWTIVHPINEESPFYELSLNDIQARDAEVLILIEAFDETFSQNVLQTNSYAQEQWKENVKFKRSFSANDKGKIVLDIDSLNELEEI
jgi:inward rectifier potassium channel